MICLSFISEPLNPSDVLQYLKSHGAIDPVVINMTQPIENIKQLVIASAPTPRLIRKYVQAVKENVGLI